MKTTAFITGAASGIGFATAKRLYQQGWTLGLADLNLADLQKVTAEWDNERVSLYQIDVCEFEQFQQAIKDFAESHNNQLNLMINNAGVLTLGAFTELTLEQHQRTININVNGLINGCYAAYPYLKQTRGAKLLNLSSASVLHGIPELSSYAASKSAVRSLTQSLNLEWQHDDIWVCDVTPPFVATNMLNNQQGSAKILKRMGVELNAEDIATAIVKQVHGRKVHFPVSLSFSCLYWLSEILPTPLVRLLIKTLSR